MGRRPRSGKVRTGLGRSSVRNQRRNRRPAPRWAWALSDCLLILRSANRQHLPATVVGTGSGAVSMVRLQRCASRPGHFRQVPPPGPLQLFTKSAARPGPRSFCGRQDGPSQPLPSPYDSRSRRLRNERALELSSLGSARCLDMAALHIAGLPRSRPGDFFAADEFLRKLPPRAPSSRPGLDARVYRRQTLRKPDKARRYVSHAAAERPQVSAVPLVGESYFQSFRATRLLTWRSIGRQASRKQTSSRSEGAHNAGSLTVIVPLIRLGPAR